MSFASRLKEQRERIGITQVALANALGITKGAVGNYESGTSSPKAEILYKLFDILRCDANFLFQDEMSELHNANATPDEMEKLVNKYRNLDKRGRRIVDAIINEEMSYILEQNKKTSSASTLPFENTDLDDFSHLRTIRHYIVPAAAGYTSPIEGEDYELVDIDDSVPSNADFCINISGDSMEPYIHDGQCIYIQRDVEIRENSDVGIWFYAGDVFCKQFINKKDGSLILLSANRNRSDADKYIPADEVVNVVCFGRVILDEKLPKINI